MEKLVCIIMGQNAEKFIKMSLESVKDSDAIVFCDGGSSDNTIDYLKSKGFKWSPNAKDKTMIFQRYDQLDKKMNGKQRNFYLDYVKKQYPNYWCLAIDADEVVEDLSKIKEMIQHEPDGLWSVKMRHLIGDLGHEDSIQPIHWVLNRLFKVKCAGKYPEVEHPVLQDNNNFEWYEGNTDCTTIWHLAYCPNMWDIKKRYESHLLKSNMHTPEYLKNWYYQHLFGTYPKRQFNPAELPEIILNEFGIDKDELYFAGRNQMEAKHYQDAIDWKNYFDLKSVFLFGCGFGQRVKVLDELGCVAVGFELSEYAVMNKLSKDIFQQDITNFKIKGNSADLTVAYDLLEHLTYECLDEAIDVLNGFSKKHILISVPFKGTPNCENDPTHIIKEDRDWWIKQFIAKGLKEVNVPAHFLYKEQLLIFKK